jgi:tetratricopeptide (TPR) repeat protein
LRKPPIVVQLLVPLLVLAAIATAAIAPPNLDKALDAERALVERQPTAERWNDLGNLLQIAGKEDEARQAYDSALSLDPELASAHYNLGLLLRQAGDDRKAINHFRRVVEIDPGNAWGWFQLGAIQEAHGSDGAAVRAYARAFALDPKLSFSDVNPQVIDSELTTRALLEAQHELPQGSEAPLAYEDPRHIRKLLLPQPPAAAAPAPPLEPEPGVTAPAPAPVTGDGRVLRPQDLRPGSRSGSVRGAAPPTGRPGMTPGSEAPGYSELLRQQLELQQQQEQDQDQLQGEEGGEVSPEGVYVPGVRSSAQLRQRIDDLHG